jgi:hypothetical protein
VTDPVMLSVATAVAGKAAEAAADGGKTALAALVRLIRGRLTGNKAADAAFNAALSRPDDPAALEEFARMLERVTAGDAGFAAQVRALWPQVQAELSAHDGGVVNTSTGTVSGHLIQTRDIHVQGSLHLGDLHGPSQP